MKNKVNQRRQHWNYPSPLLLALLARLQPKEIKRNPLNAVEPITRRD
jgi:hypothetical protein